MIDGYNIVEKLYSSSRTKVYRALRTSDKQPVVLKVRNKLISTTSIENLATEYDIAKSLQSLHIPKYLSIEDTDELSFIVLADDHMINLKSQIPITGFDIATFLKLATSITSATDAIHIQGIIHKDIKPTNIIVDSSFDCAKLIDFELASNISTERVGYKNLSVLQGTISYLSPEQTGRVNKSVDSRSDLYSLGVTFYQLLTGKLPFEETDPAKLIYLCLAQTPVPVHKIKESIPTAISMVLEKLLEKSPDRRYQTAAALKDDLAFLQNKILRNKYCDSFIPGKTERNRKLVIFDRLYGRQRETAQLLECLSKTKDCCQTVFITGASGVGKTAFVKQLYSPAIISDAFFLSGKFDDLKKNLAYTALQESFSDFVKQCLGEDEASINKWKNTIQSSVGAFGQVLTDIVPAFVDIIGKQKPLASVTPTETLTRRNFVFSNLLKDICKVRPLILFLDDIQWADSATLSLLEEIIEIDPKHLMVVLSCRDNDFSNSSTIETFIKNIDREGNSFTRIFLKNLDKHTLSTWIDDIIPDSSSNDKSAKSKLAALIMAKTKGNSFYVKSLLQSIVRNNYIKQSKNSELSIDIDAIANIAADNNIIEHLLKEMKTLSASDVEFLSKISILGNRIPITQIAHFFNIHESKVTKQIQKLVDTHLLIKIEDILTFSHDRVRQAANELLNSKQIQSLHLVAGKTIKGTLETDNFEKSNIEQFIHHFNIAEPLITNTDFRLELAKLNILEGKRQKTNAAYHTAENSFAQAIVFLPQNPFESHYSISMELYTEYGETLFINGDYAKGESVFGEIANHSKSAIDCTNAYVTQISHYASHHQPERAMRIARIALAELGIKLPQKAVKFSVLVGLLKVAYLLRTKTTTDLFDLPTTDDPLTLAQMNILSAAAVPAYIGFPDYIPLIIFWMMRISITKGNCATSPFAYSSYGLALCSLKKPQKGMAYGELSISLMKKLKSKKLYAKVPYMFGAFIHHWNAPMIESTKFFKQAVSKGMDVGDYEFASYAAANTIHHSFYSGENINKLLDKLSATHKTLEVFNKDHAIYQAKYLHQLLLTMSNPDGDGISVDGQFINEHELLSLLEEQKALPSLAFCKISKMQLAYLIRDFETANLERKQAIKLLDGLMGTIYIAICHFLGALTCIGHYRKFSKKNVLKEGKKSFAILKGLGNKSPANYLCQAILVQAELSSLGNNNKKTIELYETAIQNASKIGNNWILGIACECLGRYLIDSGIKSLGLLQIKKSIGVFHNWGATNKASRLEEEFNLHSEISSPHLEHSISINGSSEVNFQLEFDALTAAIKSLTSDLNIDSLLETLLNIVMQNSGATRVVYIQIENRKLRVHAEKNIDWNSVHMTDSQIETSLSDLPIQLLEQCVLDASSHVLRNLKSSLDEQSSKTKSILIIPLKRQQATTGLVYLENNLMEDAFRESHVQFLSLLAGQAAIAIENAFVFEKLNKERNYSANVINSSPGLICGIDNSGVTTFANPITEEISGYSQEELIGENWWRLFFPQSEYKQVERFFAIFPDGEAANYELQFTSKNGDKKSIVWNSFARKDDRGNVIETIGFGTDITERKRSEEAIKLFQSAADASTDAIGMSTLEGRHYYQNAAFDKLFGSMEIVGEDPIQLYVNNSVGREVFSSIKRGTPWSGEIQMFGPKKEILDIWLRAYAVTDKKGRVTTLIGLHTDITKRKKSEFELSQLRNYLSNIIDSMPSLLVGVDCNSLVTQWNKKAELTTGIPADLAMGKNLYEVFPEIESESDSIAQSISTMETIQKLRQPRSLETGVRYEDIIIYPLVSKDSSGSSNSNVSRGAVLKIHDVTEKVLMEEMIVQSEKMLSIGGLAAGMAHEINNPLAGMTQGAAVLSNRLSRLDLPANIRAANEVGTSMETISSFMEARGVPLMLNSIVEAGTRASKIVTNMLSFSRKSESISAECDLKALLDQSVELAQSSYDLEKKFDFKRIKIVREYQENLPLVKCEEAKIQQVLMNILRNGAEAMQTGTTGDEDPCFIFRLINKREEKMVCLEIQDNGPGMTEEVRRRIFEPFYTTKAAGSGTGLGLSVSYFIITENHNGKMTVESSLGKGTNFIIYLPVQGAEK